MLAARIANGEPSRFGVSASTDSFGSFSIDGFEAEEYPVKVHPVRTPDAQPSPMRSGPRCGAVPDAERSLLPEASLEFREADGDQERSRGAPENAADRSRSTFVTIHLRVPENRDEARPAASPRCSLRLGL